MSTNESMNLSGMQVGMQPTAKSPVQQIASDSITHRKARIEDDLKTGIAATTKWTWIAVCIFAAIGLGILSLLFSLDIHLTGPDASGSSIIALIASIISLTFAGIGLICVPFVAHYKKKIETQLKAMKDGQYVGHWTYSNDQWKWFIKDEEKEASSWVSVSLIAFGIMAFATCFLVNSISGMTGCLVAIIGLLSLGYAIGKLIEHLQLKKLECWRAKSWFAVIGFQGLYYNGKYFPYSMFGSGLDEVQFVSGQKMKYLVFTFFTHTNDGRTYTDRRIPVPFGKEEEAEAFVNLVS